MSVSPSFSPTFSIRAGNSVDFSYSTAHTRVQGRLVIPEAPATQLLVVLNGAVDRARSSLPVFQRSSWEELASERIVLFLCDPTLSLSEDLSIGWGIGCLEESGIKAMGETVAAVRFFLHTEGLLDKILSSTMYFGSSAGGFQALQLASSDGSRTGALAINPQARVTDYFPKAVDAALWAALGTNSINAAFAQYSERLDLGTFFNLHGVPFARVLINNHSREDMNRDFLRLSQFVSSRPLLDKSLEFAFYSSPNGGHNPPTREETLREIDNFSARLSKEN